VIVDSAEGISDRRRGMIVLGDGDQQRRERVDGADSEPVTLGECV
jgi:hypothetical protein